MTHAPSPEANDCSPKRAGTRPPPPARAVPVGPRRSTSAGAQDPSGPGTSMTLRSRSVTVARRSLVGRVWTRSPWRQAAIMQPTTASPSAAFMCRDLTSRPAWRAVISVRSWRAHDTYDLSARRRCSHQEDAERVRLLWPNLPVHRTVQAHAMDGISRSGAPSGRRWRGCSAIAGCRVVRGAAPAPGRPGSARTTGSPRRPGPPPGKRWHRLDSDVTNPHDSSDPWTDKTCGLAHDYLGRRLHQEKTIFYSSLQRRRSDYPVVRRREAIVGTTLVSYAGHAATAYRYYQPTQGES